jgi:hypothetical protein
MGILKNLFFVPVIMACATAGTIGLLKLVQRFNKDSGGGNQEAGKQA